MSKDNPRPDQQLLDEELDDFAALLGSVIKRATDSRKHGVDFALVLVHRHDDYQHQCTVTSLTPDACAKVFDNAASDMRKRVT